MIDLSRLEPNLLSTEPYRWAFIDRLFSNQDAQGLASTFPCDHFKTVGGYDGEKGYQYEARSLAMMGATGASHREALSPHWQRLAQQLLSQQYREAMSSLTGVNLMTLPIEINVFHYGRSAWLGPHVDLEDKLVTHVLYFNEEWNESDGGCLTVLRSGNINDAVKVIPPVIGNSVVLVRSSNSWHAVTRVREQCRISRRSLTLTFYRPGSVSTMWPPGDTTPLHDYKGERSALGKWVSGKWRRLRSQAQG